MKVFNLMRHNPLGFVLACVFSLAFIFAALSAAAYAAFFLAAPSLLKGAVSASTGFETTAEKINANFFTGNIEIKNLIIKNPKIYTLLPPASGLDNQLKTLVVADKITLNLSPWALLRGDIELNSFAAEISQINRILLRKSACNIDEFAGKIFDVISISESGGQRIMYEFSLNIKNASYYVISGGDDFLAELVELNFSFYESDITDIRAMLNRLGAELSQSGAPFLSECGIFKEGQK